MHRVQQVSDALAGARLSRRWLLDFLCSRRSVLLVGWWDVAKLLRLEELHLQPAVQGEEVG